MSESEQVLLRMLGIPQAAEQILLSKTSGPLGLLRPPPRWSVASSTQLADQAAEELMAASAQSVGQADAARAFWFRLMAGWDMF